MGGISSGNAWHCAQFGIHDCCPGGDGRKPGVNVPKADYITNLGVIYAAASKARAAL